MIEEFSNIFSQHFDNGSFQIVFGDEPPVDIVDLSRFIGGDYSGAMEEHHAPVTVRRKRRRNPNDIHVWAHVILSVENQRNRRIWYNLFHPKAKASARAVIKKNWTRPFFWEPHFLSFNGSFRRKGWHIFNCWFEVKFKVAWKGNRK